jgi:hypothetical protein
MCRISLCFISCFRRRRRDRHMPNLLKHLLAIVKV